MVCFGLIYRPTVCLYSYMKVMSYNHQVYLAAVEKCSFYQGRSTVFYPSQFLEKYELLRKFVPILA